LVSLVVSVHAADLVAEEARRFVTGVSDQVVSIFLIGPD